MRRSKQRHVRHVAAGQHLERALAVGGLPHLEARASQRLLHRESEGGVVIDEEDVSGAHLTHTVRWPRAKRKTPFRTRRRAQK
jgi:hypothetical protein